MRLIRSLELSANAESTGDLVERVLAAVEPTVPVWVYLENGHGKINAAQRAIKKHPSIAQLRSTSLETPRSVLASLPPEDHEGPDRWSLPVAREVARDIARGVPKSLPFNYSNFVFGPVPELWLAPGAPPEPRCLDARTRIRKNLATVIVESSWWTSRRQLRLELVLCMIAPAADAKKLPPLPPDTKRLVDALGRIRKEQQYLEPDETESHAVIEAEPAAKLLVERTDLQQIVDLPHPDLADDPQRDGAFGSFKDALQELLPSYRYDSPRSGRGVWVLAKRTAANNELAVTVDRGPLGGEAQAWLRIAGAQWSHSFRLPASRSATKLRVWDPGTLRAVCRNWVAAIEAVERDVIPELERLYWPGFAWYKP